MPTASPISRRDVRRIESPAWLVDRKMRVVLDGLRRRRSIAELCSEAGISPASYYRWRSQFINAAQIGLAQPGVERHVLEERIEQLEGENADLKRLVEILKLCAVD